MNYSMYEGRELIPEKSSRGERGSGGNGGGGGGRRSREELSRLIGPRMEALVFPP